MSKSTVRLNSIMQTLKEHGLMKISFLAKQLNVSEMTIRRDLKELELGNVVSVLRGTAVLNFNKFNLNGTDQYFISNQKQQYSDIKIKIAKKAVLMLEPNDNIIIDVGSTAYFFARELPEDIPLTVICYSANVLFELLKKENCKIIFTGGYFHRNTLMCESAEGVNFLKKHRANKGFIGATGINEKLGITCSNNYESDVKQAAIKSSLKKILLADSRKFDRISTTYFADLSEFDILITDKNISLKSKKILERKNVELIMV